MPQIPADRLRTFSTQLLTAGGLDPREAALVADSLVEANLQGHDSHGVMRIPYYLDTVAKHEILPGQQLEILRESDSLIVADGHWGFGQTLARQLVELLIPKARATGVAIGTLVHSGHVGRLGEYCQQAADAGLISLLMVNTHGTARRVAPPGGTAPRLGTNPLAIGIPAEEGPLVLDFGTSATAEGKVRVKRIAGQTCPDGWLLDSQGNPTNDPNSLYGNPPGTIRPMGGDQAFKGFGLALMIEIFAGALSGGRCAREVPLNQLGNCVYIQLIDPAHLGGNEHFASELSQLTHFVRSCPRTGECDEILLPGDPERRVRARRLAEGIPFDDGNWRQLAELATRLNVPLP